MTVFQNGFLIFSILHLTPALCEGWMYHFGQVPKKLHLKEPE